MASKLSKKNFIIGKDPFKGLYLQFSFKIIDEDLKKVRYEILDENKNSIYASKNEYLNTPLEINEISYLQLTSFKNTLQSDIYIVIYKEDNTSEEFNEKINVNNFYLGNIETKEINDEFISFFTWQTEAYTVQDLYGHIKAVWNGNTYYSIDKAITNGSLQTKISQINIQEIINSLKETGDPSLSKINYCLEILDSNKNIIKTIPESGMLSYSASYENEAPNLRFSNLQLKRYGEAFQLETDLIFHDNNLDDVKFIIEDNQGNVIIQEDYYSYSPRIQKLIYNYDIKYFNSLFLELNTTVTDNLTFTERRTEKVKLFSVENLRIRRNRLFWDVRNFSSSVLKTNVEILDINNNIVYQGPIMLNKTELNYVTVTDDTEIELIEEKISNYEYYKFRIRVFSEEEGYLEYVEFDTGTLVSSQHHVDPVITIYEDQCELIRDEDDNKRVHLVFNINGKIGDQFKYSIFDDSGNSIYRIDDYLSFPEKDRITNANDSYKQKYRGDGINFDLMIPYDFCKMLSTEITIHAVTEYGKVGRDSIILDSYYVRNLRLRNNSVLLNHIVQFDCDNYSIYELNVVAEVYQFIYEEKIDENDHKYLYFDDNKLLSENAESLYKEITFPLTNTLETIYQELRFIPKLPIQNIKEYDEYGQPKSFEYYLYGVRLRIDCPELNIYCHKYIYPNKNSSLLLKSIPEKNTPPTIDINWVKTTFFDYYKKLKLNISATFADGDFDNMWNSISDKYETIYDSEGYVNYGIDNSININTQKIYDLDNIETSYIKLYFKNVDEDGSKVEEYYNIPLHSITNISYLNGEFNWCYRLYNKAPVNMVLEILDEQGYLYSVSKPIKCSFSDNLIPVKEYINLDNFEAGIYRYRIRTFSPTEAWNYYSPNLNGNYFNVEEQIKLDIDIENTSISNGNLTINKTIKTSATDGRKFTYYVYDDVE